MRGQRRCFTNVHKTYEALVFGHIVDDEREIDLPLQRDHTFPPFMRVSTPEGEAEAVQLVEQLHHAGWKKTIRKSPKPCRTKSRVLRREMYGEEPVTRLA